MDEGKQQRERQQKKREGGFIDNQEVRVLVLWATGALVVTPE
jgi:hypothetical protein